MKLYVKQKIFSLNNKFTIKDEYENDLFFVEGELFTLGHKLHVYDERNDEVALIKQKLLTLLPKYEVYFNDELITTIEKELTFLKQQYTLQDLDWQVVGDVFAHEYTIMNSDITIASISKAWLTLADSYEIDIIDKNNTNLVIAIVLAIDCVIASTNNGA